MKAWLEGLKGVAAAVAPLDKVMERTNRNHVCFSFCLDGAMIVVVMVMAMMVMVMVISIII